MQDVVDKLETVVSGMTVADARGCGREKARVAVYRGAHYRLELLPKVMIEVVTDDNKVDDLVKILSEAAHTGEIGDGRIFVVDVGETYHIRTGFRD
jgi:nitrogen regulatory protein PII